MSRREIIKVICEFRYCRDKARCEESLYRDIPYSHYYLGYKGAAIAFNKAAHRVWRDLRQNS